MRASGASRAERTWTLITDCAGSELVTAGHVCRAATKAVNADGAALWAATRADRRALVHATDQVALLLDDQQLTLGEGPGVDAWTRGTPVLAPDLYSAHSTARWPVFAPAATATGAAALFSFPLQAGAIGLGTLELYRTTAGPLSAEELADALTFTSAALAVMLTATHQTSTGPPRTVWPLADMGSGHVEVYQATGMIAAQLGADLTQAFVRLRAHAFTEGIEVAQVAGQVLDRSLRFTPDDPTASRGRDE